MLEKRRILALCCAAHFAVDFACALLLLGGLSEGAGRPFWLLLYNFCAFALQMPLGLAADRYGLPIRLAAAGCLLTGAAYLFRPVPVLAVLAAGTGNALFHVGAGTHLLHMEKKRCGPLGLFVSPGALGLYLGALPALCRPGVLILTPLLLFGGGLIFWRAQKKEPLAALSFFPVLSAGGRFSAVCLFLAVCLRSLLSLSLPLPWKRGELWGLCLTLFTVLGKALGGFLADRFGPRRISFLALAFCLPLLFFCGLPLPGLLAVGLINMTMPITLWALAQLLPGAKGFAFGILTFALFLGFLPGYLHIGPALSPAGAAAGAAVFLLLLQAALRKGR
ncbi:MAG: MFS transporter [Provencibacterium sp.]|jgi:FSR family fosmidomycin resistance protein-like MFS transporter|nr:MFS transporter [Provencibacterium sp.]